MTGPGNDTGTGSPVAPPQSNAGHLTPTQLRTLDALRRSGEPVVFDPDLIAELRAEMHEAIEHFTARADGRDVFVSKYRIASVLDCEAQHLAPEPFHWSAANAKGTVAHRAIQLQLNWRGEPTPAELVDEAIARLADEDRSIGAWIATLSPADDADLRGQSIVRVTQFMEGFPPLQPRWRPLTEAPVRWPVAGPIVLSGKVDLVFGAPRGAESTKVIIDLKTGRPNARHRQDLGFYALVETLVRSIPPRKVATFYLDAAEAHADDVSERLLRSAMRRTLDAIDALVELEIEGRPPTKRPGVGCRWCPLASECDEGQAWLAGRDTDTMLDDLEP